MSRVSISAAWEETKAVLARDGRLLVAVALALFVLPGVVVELLAPSRSAGDMTNTGAGSILTLIGLLVALVGQLAVLRLAMGPRVAVGDAIAHGARRMLPYLAASMLWILPIALPLAYFMVKSVPVSEGATPQLAPGSALAVLLLFCAGLAVAVRMLMTSPVASAEAIGPIAIIKRSWQLTRGNWMRLFGFLLLFLIAALILLLAASTVIGLAARMMFGELEPMSLGRLVVALVSQALGATLSTVFMVMLARIYVQLAQRGGAEVSVPSSS